MYHPYFRGKQFELITVRESASTLAASNFVPIIEPVKEALGSLEKTLDAICDAKGNAIVIVNPSHGDHSDDGKDISSLLKKRFLQKPAIAAGVLLTKDVTLDEAIACCEKHQEHGLTLVHAGFGDGKALADSLNGKFTVARHVFLDKYCGKLYRKHFGGKRVLLHDGFITRRNRDHPKLETFSDLHVTYAEDGFNGFGDFLTVGDEFSESGGPAFAVAIHITFIDPKKDSAMFIYHFVSDSKDTPTNPAGKFAEALDKMVKKLNSGSAVLETSAIQEFRELHAKKHFPGLGYVKKLSMKHHIETLAEYFK